ncbi:MAG TPA: LON peptidase substrate-binding domain-containing protein [Methylocystis sp.]|nr:LON peptidase substrate-binding domain-containing protein [Methylocystis sp.]
MGMNAHYASIVELPELVRLFPLPGALLLPRGELPLNIFEPRYLAMVDEAIASDRLIGMIQPVPGEDELKLFQIGCVGRLTHFCETGDGRYLITLTGVARFKTIGERRGPEPFRRAQVSFGSFEGDLLAGDGEERVDRARMVLMLREFAETSGVEVDWASIDAAPTETLVNALAMMCPFGVREKQSLLEAIDLKTRAEILIGLAAFELARDPPPRGRRREEPPQFH